MNKGAIRTHFKALLNRSDITDALADTFVDQSISRIQRTLRVPAMEKIQTYTVSSQTAKIVVPNDLLEIIGIYHNTTSLTRLPLHDMLTATATGETGTANHFTQQGGDVLLFPQPISGTVSVSYYSQFADMSLDSDESSLAQFASDMIIYGALTYASDYYLDDRGPIFEQKFVGMMSEIQEQANDAANSGTIQVMRPSATYTDY